MLALQTCAVAEQYGPVRVVTRHAEMRTIRALPAELGVAGTTQATSCCARMRESWARSVA